MASIPRPRLYYTNLIFSILIQPSLDFFDTDTNTDFCFIILKCKMQVKSAKAYEVSNETFESQEANKDDYLRARKLDKLTNAKKREEEGFHWSMAQVSNF